MQDRNAKAPKVRSGDEINPVLGTIVKVAALVVIAALIVLITLIIIEVTKKDNDNTIHFEERIRIPIDDFKIIVEGQNHDELSKSVYDIMVETEEDDDILFFFYYSNLIDRIDSEIKKVVEDRDETAVIFIVDLSYAPQDEEGDYEETIKDYISSNSDLVELEIFTILNQQEDGNKKYPYFLLVFNEEQKNINENPFEIIVTNNDILSNIKNLPQKVEEE
ncbi:MAG TPA: hypothetical protein GX012_01645 [Acholeplasma sp.]|nr:hypothetical protein [Acholeplasma sp.]